MAPLILHNVPDDECYVGDDGVRRPYAMYFNHHEGHTGSMRTRRSMAESGSFGKSTKRSRSRTITAPSRTREAPTYTVADKIFGEWVSSQPSKAPPAVAHSRKSGGSMHDKAVAREKAAARRLIPLTPVEIILRGYRSPSQQYASIARYEELAGAILEDYPRNPPLGQRRYKSELRDTAITRTRQLNAEQRGRVNHAAGGVHWVKVTFESAEAAEAAISASPQRVLGCLVHAELYRGYPPTKDEACPDLESLLNVVDEPPKSIPVTRPARGPSDHRKGASGSGMPTLLRSRLVDLSPPNSSRTTSQTLDSATLTTTSSSSATMTATPELGDPADVEDSDYCRRIPSARRVRLLPAEEALLPQQSAASRFFNSIPLINWFSGSMIGNEVPRTETGEFDWGRASLYWKFIWWLDATFDLFRGDVYSVDKDD
ncbi:hypothetical protein E4U32_007955 [Claviceps aff. humidiphila group G2b]|nr:hypothetical protein E4U32_007955 [Claviceps aff. humidiphila group G2b]